MSVKSQSVNGDFVNQNLSSLAVYSFLKLEAGNEQEEASCLFLQYELVQIFVMAESNKCLQTGALL